MRKKLLTHSLMILFFLFDALGFRIVAGSAAQSDTKPNLEENRKSSAPTLPEMSVELSTPTHNVIRFDASESETGTTADSREIPHLVLHRNGVLTPGYERTLDIVANNVRIYSPGVYVILTISTQHADPDHEGKGGNKIQVWSDKQFVPFTSQTQHGVRLNFSVMFDRYTKLNDKAIKTPTDYFQYRISIVGIDGKLKQSYARNYAFLMENHWRTPLPKLLEVEPGASPDQLLVYYCDMIPFQANKLDQSTQIPRQDVEQYIQVELVPAMVQAILTQSNDWGFAWYPEWSNFRRDEEPKTLSVALSGQSVWFHGEAPPLGHSMISIRVDGSAGEYDNLTDGLMSIFHHELFHNHQRNIALHFSGNGNVSGKEEAWLMFTEGTAVLASSVGQPQVQLDPKAIARSYMKRANAYIGAEGSIGGGLNKSYEKIPYHTAAYWRFLYEQCGGVEEGIEYPAAGMGVIRTVLETLYDGEIVNVHSSTNWTKSLPRVMDIALARSPTCPFQTYVESLSEFAQSIYMLRLENGRCDAVNTSDCGFYDPNSLYNLPPFDHASVDTRPATYVNGNIPASYGIDLIELAMDPSTDGKSLLILFDVPSGSKTDFTVQLVMTKSTGSKPVYVNESKSQNTEDGRVAFDVGTIKLNEYDCIGLIITRIDPAEEKDAIGNYTIQAVIQ